MEFSFFFPTNDRGGTHIVGCLMQGLHQLGHKIYSNIPVHEFVSHGIFPAFSSLFPGEIEVTPDMSRGCLIVDAFNGLGNFSRPLIDAAKTNKIVLLDMNDSSNYRDYDESFLVFKVHSNSNAIRGGRIFPMGFGITQEAIEFTKQEEFSLARDGILRNFRPSINQTVRNCLDLILVPRLKDHFKITENISTQSQYLTDLKTHKAVLAYGGDIYNDLRLNPYFLGNKEFEFQKLASEPVIMRFDSWRYYEAALFGTCPIALDFERYGLETGANPVAWKEYIPIDFSQINATMSKIVKSAQDDPLFFEKIGRNARDWVLNNHSPVAVAQRILNVLRMQGMV